MLGWDPLDLTAEGLEIADLLQECAWIDGSVPAVSHMQGGSQVSSAAAHCSEVHYWTSP